MSIRAGSATLRFKRLIWRIYERRELSRLRSIPRFSRTTTRLLGARIQVPDGASFAYMYREIVQQGIYRFRASRAEPRIIDCGANIGVSVAYFKRLYPGARIVAFEPDPDIFATLSANISALALEDIELHQAAVSVDVGPVRFRPDGADGGRLSASGEGLSVNSVRLGSWLEEPIDLLKLDIEGAEVEVLADCQSMLGNVANCFVEYHSFADRPQRLVELLEILRTAGYRTHVHVPFAARQPLWSCPTRDGMDMQLNLFGVR